MLKSEERFREVNEKLGCLTYYVQLCNQQGMTDINHLAEEFFCGLLNIIFDTNLTNMNYIQRNYPAIDLGDREEGLAIQVTSTSSRDKIAYTLEKFFETEQDQIYNQLIVLVIGKKENYRKKFPTKRRFRFDPGQDVWDTARLCEEIMQLDDGKQEEVLRYLEAKMDIPKPAASAAPAAYSEPGERKLKRYLPITLGPDAFLGRKTELDKLGRALADNVNPIFITGLGGMGKTELAIRFCQKRPQDTLVHFVRFTDDFRHTVSRGIAPGIENLRLTDYDNKARSDDQIYREAMDVLRKCGQDTLLVIDNADPADGDFGSLKDETYKELCGMDLRLVITTRAAIPGAVKVEEMDVEELLAIFRLYCGMDDCSDDMAKNLIKAVDRHTLTVDLMARTMTEGWNRVEPQTLLDALRSNSLSEAVDQPVGTNYNRDDEQKRIHEHLRAVFRVTDIPRPAQIALQCATLIPEGGMNARLFGNALSAEVRKTLDQLCKLTWIRRTGSMATIHPVVRLVCHDALKPTDESCGSFLEALWSRYDRKKYDHNEYTQLAELFTAAAEKLENRNGNWSAHGRTLWQELGQFNKALLCAQKTLERRLAALPGDHLDLADAYNDLGLVYQGLMDTQGMEENFGKALKIRQRNPAVDPVDLGKSYNNVGVVYDKQKDYRTALDYKLKALAIFREHLPADDLDLALSLDHIGSVYHHLGEFNTALEFHDRALTIRKNVLPPDHPDIAYSYSELDSSWYSLGNNQKALEFGEKSRAIREKVLPPDHPDIAHSYYALGCTWYRAGNYQKALECHEKSRAIREKVLPQDHPDIAHTYHELGVTWYHLGNYQKALDFHEKAKTIHSNETDLAVTYYDIGFTYLAMKEYAPALDHLEKSLPGLEAKLSPGDPAIKDTKDAIAYCKRKLTRPNWMDQIQ